MTVLLYFVFLALLFPKNSYAYLDPGTGSYIVQAVIALLATGGFLIKTYWSNIKNFLSKKPKDEDH